MTDRKPPGYFAGEHGGYKPRHPEPGRIERVPLSINRYAWTYTHGDGWSTAGWSATKWGARRQLARLAENDAHMAANRCAASAALSAVDNVIPCGRRWLP